MNHLHVPHPAQHVTPAQLESLQAAGQSLEDGSEDAVAEDDVLQDEDPEEGVAVLVDVGDQPPAILELGECQWPEEPSLRCR